ncbi:MAG: hypothetical protein O7H41_02205 [Planctomycetota bacterium]|nr:hypothetical protein [Planctomycetota bacterium]
MKRTPGLTRWIVASAVLPMIAVLAGCPGIGTNPLDPSSFTNQFKHTITFSIGSGTEPDSNVNADGTDLVMMQIRAKVDSPSEPIRIDRLSFRASGTADDSIDVAWVRLYRDRNGDAALDSGDQLLGTAGQYSSDNGLVRFGGLNEVIDDGDAATYLLVYDLAGTASLGDTFAIRLADESDVDGEGDDSGCPLTIEGIPVRSPTRTVSDVGGGSNEVMVTLGSATPTAGMVNAPASAVEMLQIAIDTSGYGDVSIEAITFDARGTGDESRDLAAVYFYHDVDGDGLVSPGDLLLGQGDYALDNGSVTFSGLGLTVIPGASTNLLVAYDVLPSEVQMATFQVGIDSGLDVIAYQVSSQMLLSVDGPPFQSEVLTVD